MTDISSTILTTLGISACAVAASLPVAVPLAWVLSRRRFFGQVLVEAIIALPLVLPPVVTGVFLLLLLGRRGPIGEWLEQTFGVTLLFTPVAAAVAAAVVSFPLLVRTLRVAFDGVERGLEQAARTCGAGPFTAFFTVTLPAARTGVWMAIILAFARAMGEFGATLVVAGTLPGNRRTLPIEIWRQLQSGHFEEAWPLVGAAAALAFLAVLVGEVVVRRGRQ
ncbi:MAG: molybdate ABC transporter permease subunit [Planctomycetota bacterium]|nr:molybdate ABC transporter permease subunit [Planctomycetota bacterium]